MAQIGKTTALDLKVSKNLTLIHYYKIKKYLILKLYLKIIFN